MVINLLSEFFEVYVREGEGDREKFMSAWTYGVSEIRFLYEYLAIHVSSKQNWVKAIILFKV